MEDYESQRLENLKQKEQLLAQLNLDLEITGRKSRTRPSSEPRAKKRKLNTSINPHPTRTSSRLASSRKTSYTSPEPKVRSSKPPNRKQAISFSSSTTTSSRPSPNENTTSLRLGWTSWTATAPPPTRSSSTGTFHFPSHPHFQPNKSPQEIIQEGSFGGSYWRPLHSRTLNLTIQNDYLELPPHWLANLNISTHLTSPTYNPAANKYAVACGQSIEEWEAAGWINHKFDVRGWFQWYCRFFQGRRCEDDDRQVGRWMRCVGPTGRWRRMLLKKYVASGVREVFDDGDEEEERQVSPVMHQTCHHWAFEVRQDVLDEFWKTGK
jgi:hypothetical protein